MSSGKSKVVGRWIQRQIRMCHVLGPPEEKVIEGAIKVKNRKFKIDRW